MADIQEKLCLLVCRHFLTEAEAILHTPEFEDVSVHAYAPVCSHPQLASTWCEQLAEAQQHDSNEVLLLGGCLLTSPDKLSGLPPHCQIHHIDHCFYLLTNPRFIDAQIQSGAYLLTPGWLSEWKQHLKEWGFDQATARAFFGECSSTLLLLDTGSDKQSQANLAAMADYLDRPSQVVSVGQDYFRLILTQIILEWRLKKSKQAQKILKEYTNRKVADQAMAFDMLVGLTQMKNEDDVIMQIIHLFSMLFAPKKIVYASVVNGRVNITHTFPSVEHNEHSAQEDWIANGQDDNIIPEEGFYLRFHFQNKLLGMMELQSLALPERKQEYLNTATPIARLCGLAIANARMFQEVQQLAITDSLTGLFNRRHFFTLSRTEFARSYRYNRPLAALMLDLDHFKSINDTYGHAAGDRVLIEVAQCCQRELRNVDIRGRFGGEEFVVLMPETSREKAWLAAERLRKSIADLVIIFEQQTINVTASIGLSILDEDCKSLDLMLDRSDKALYCAKQCGRNRVCTWTEGLNSEKPCDFDKKTTEE